MKLSVAKPILLLLMVSLLSACSSTTFIYNRLDFLLPWYLGDYMDLDRQQKDQLDDLLTPFLDWHRMEELPRYLQTVERMEANLDQPASLSEIEGVSREFEEAWSRLEVRGLDWMLALGEQLSDEQLASFMEKLKEQQLEYEEEYLPRSEEEYREETYESLLESFDSFLGRLNDAQKQRLQETADAMHRSDAAWLEERALWLTKLEGILQREPGWQQAIRDALAARNETNSPEYEEVYQHNMRQIHLAIVDVTNSRTPKQDKRVRKKLKGFRQDLTTLIRQGEKA